MTLAIILGSALTGASLTLLICSYNAHFSRKEAYKQGKYDGFAEGMTAGREHGFQRGKHAGYVDGLRRGKMN